MKDARATSSNKGTFAVKFCDIVCSSGMCVYSIIIATITNHSLTYKAYMLWKCMIKTSGFSSNTTITENCCDSYTNHVYQRKHTNSA